MAQPTDSLAEKGIDASIAFLENKGMKVIEHGYKNGYGKVELIALQDDTVVFVKVKTRARGPKAGVPAIEVTPQMVQRLTKLAQKFCDDSGLEQRKIRLDHIGIFTFNENQALLRYTRGINEA